MNTPVLFFQASIIVLLIFCNASEGTTIALQNWITNDKKGIDYGGFIYSKCIESKNTDSKDIVWFKDIAGTTVTAGQVANDKTTLAAHCSYPNGPASTDKMSAKEVTDALFLPYLEDKATYRLIDPWVQDWFFTARLTGCEIWIADANSAGDMVVVHINTITIRDPVEKLTHSEQLADDILPILKKQTNHVYHFALRITVDYVGLKQNNKDNEEYKKFNEEEINNYWQKYEQDGGAHIFYEDKEIGFPGTFFYGMFEDYEWNFVFKDLEGKKDPIKIACIDNQVGIPKQGGCTVQ